jgi:hypothetical protein
MERTLRPHRLTPNAGVAGRCGEPTGCYLAVSSSNDSLVAADLVGEVPGSRSASNLNPTPRCRGGPTTQAMPAGQVTHDMGSAMVGVTERSGCQHSAAEQLVGESVHRGVEHQGGRPQILAAELEHSALENE